MELDAGTTNQLFLDRLRSDGQEKIAAAQSDVVRQKILEDGFMRKLMAPKDIDRNDPHIQEDLKTDTIYYLEHVERLSYAMSLNIRGNGNSNVWYAKKYPISFHKIETERIKTDEYTIRAMPYPFFKDMESKFPTWIQMVEDREGVLHFEAACQTIQKWDNGSVTKLAQSTLGSCLETAVRKSELARIETTDNFTIQVPQRSDFAYLARMFPGFSGESLRGSDVLITETDAEGFGTWQYEDIAEGAWDVTKDGYKPNTVLGHKFIKTNKTSILRPGNMYMMAPSQFGGKFLRFIDTTVEVAKYGDRIESWAWEVIGMGFANLRFVKKCELYSGSVTPANETAGYAAVQPLSEEEIVQETVRTEQSDGYVPVIY